VGKRETDPKKGDNIREYTKESKMVRRGKVVDKCTIEDFLFSFMLSPFSFFV